MGYRVSKVAGPAVAIGDLGPLDAILLTHDHHADNLDAAGRTLLADVPTVITTVAGAARLGGGDDRPRAVGDDAAGGARADAARASSPHRAATGRR